MPRLRTFGKKPPEGFDEIEDQLEEFERLWAGAGGSSLTKAWVHYEIVVLCQHT